jgi:hypothetical protein
MNKSPSAEEKPDLRVERYIKDWNWDAASYEFALQMGIFLLQFIDDLRSSDLLQETIRKHESNCWLIGAFECDYGYHDTFTPVIFLGCGTAFLYEFKRKMRASKYAIASYKSTWRKIEKYVKTLAHDNAGH